MITAFLNLSNGREIVLDIYIFDANQYETIHSIARGMGWS
jgi:hypothetical protein